MSEKLDFYEILGLEPSCTEKQIKKAFRILAMKCHPDLNPDNIEESTKRFSQIQQAYETLMDPNERAWYDEHRNQPDELEESEMINLRKYMFNDQLYDLDEEDDRNPFSFYHVIGEIYERLINEEFKYGIDLMQHQHHKNKKRNKPKPQRKGKSKKRKNRRGGRSSSNHNSPSTPYGENVRKDDFPRFGTSKTGKKKLKQFYDFWGVRFKTKKTFSWSDPYKTKDGRNRDMRKQIIKENEKIRKLEKLKYSKLVKSFTSYIKKRDPRWKKFRKRKVEMRRQQIEKEELLKEILEMEEHHHHSEEEEEEEESKSEEEEEEEEEHDLDSFFDAMDSKKKKKKEPRKEQKNIYKGSTRRKKKKKKNNFRRKQKQEDLGPVPGLTQEDDSDDNEVEDEIEEIENLLFGGGGKKKNKKRRFDSDDEEVMKPKQQQPKMSKKEKRKMKRKQRREKMKQKEKEKQKLEEEEEGEEPEIEIEEVVDRKKKKKKNEYNFGGGKNNNFMCKRCERSFGSRSKLFKHLRESGHAVPIQ